MEGSRFLLPFSENIKRGLEKRFSEIWFDPLFGVPAAGRIAVSTAVPLWPSGTRALKQHGILETRLRKTAIKPPENSSQFAVWSLY
jgi:hypothetical protein